MEKQIFKKALDKYQVRRPIFKNTIKAFLIGGLICVIAEGLIELFTKVVGLEDTMSNSLMSVTLVLVSSVLTGIGWYDKIGQFAGAGSIIPITGFSNSMTSAALESKSEGVVLGVMSNMFKLAGAIIVAGVVSAFLSGTIIYLIQVIK